VLPPRSRIRVLKGVPIHGGASSSLNLRFPFQGRRAGRSHFPLNRWRCSLVALCNDISRFFPPPYDLPGPFAEQAPSSLSRPVFPLPPVIACSQFLAVFPRIFFSSIFSGRPFGNQPVSGHMRNASVRFFPLPHPLSEIFFFRALCSFFCSQTRPLPPSTGFFYTRTSPSPPSPLRPAHQITWPLPRFFFRSVFLRRRLFLSPLTRDMEVEAPPRGRFEDFFLRLGLPLADRCAPVLFHSFFPLPEQASPPFDLKLSWSVVFFFSAACVSPPPTA